MIQLHNGGCLEVMQSIPDQSVELILCDLPYGTTRNKWDAVIPFDPLWAAYRRICRGAIVLTAAQPFTSALVMSNLRDFKYQWVWEKSLATGFLNAKKQPMRAHEDIAVFYSSQPTYNPQKVAGAPRKYVNSVRTHSTNYGLANKPSSYDSDERYPRSVIQFPGRDVGAAHPTQKPVALMEYLIRTYTNVGDTVMDNCMGSGTTGVACVNTDRSFIGIERDPDYFKIAQGRIDGALDELLMTL